MNISRYLCIKFKKGDIKMARPIKETPVLTGKDAKAFEKRLKTVKPASEEELNRLKESYKVFKKIATFRV